MGKIKIVGTLVSITIIVFLVNVRCQRLVEVSAGQLEMKKDFDSIMEKAYPDFCVISDMLVLEASVIMTICSYVNLNYPDSYYTVTREYSNNIYENQKLRKMDVILNRYTLLFHRSDIFRVKERTQEYDGYLKLQEAYDTYDYTRARYLELPYDSVVMSCSKIIRDSKHGMAELNRYKTGKYQPSGPESYRVITLKKYY